MKKKAGGIFSFLMDFAMKFIGLKILDWISKEENREKVQKIVSFFQGVIQFLGVVGKAIGDAFNFTVDAIEKGIEGMLFLGGEIQKFFSFEWLDLDALLEPIQPMITFFTETIPNAFNGFIDALAGFVQQVDALPEQFVGIVDNIVNGFLGFLGLEPENTEDFKEPTQTEPISQGLVPNNDSGSGQPTEVDKEEKNKNQDLNDLPQMKRGGMLHGATHAQGGVPIGAEGGEYVLNKRMQLLLSVEVS